VRRRLEMKEEITWGLLLLFLSGLLGRDFLFGRSLLGGLFGYGLLALRGFLGFGFWFSCAGGTDEERFLWRVIWIYHGVVLFWVMS